MNVALTLAVSLFLVSGAIGVYASLTGREKLLVVFKPLTTALLLAAVGWPQSRFAWLVVIGIIFSLGGDVALLFRAKNGFLIGLGLFLVTHACYIAAFLGVARARGTSAWSPGVLVPALVMVAVTGALLRKLWSGASGLRAPLVGYAAALALMVVSAFAAQGPRGVAASAAIGAVCFYVADCSLALDRFARPIKYAPLLTLGLYWLGQLGIAVAIRGFGG